jgi:hypothetical protein
MTSESESASPAPRTGRSRLVIAVVVAVAVFAAAAIAVWQLNSNDDTSNASSTTISTVPRTPPGVAARIVTTAQLRSFAAALGRPVYWAGARRGARMEYTQASDGSAYVRYLTGSAAVGDKHPKFVVVATYPQPDAFARVRKAARTNHYKVEQLSGGAIAVTEPRTPKNIHIVSPGQPYQVEVFAPSAAQARKIVLSGAVVPVA